MINGMKNNQAAGTELLNSEGKK